MGPGGCTGYQVCNTSGAYDPCICGDAGTSTDSGSDVSSTTDGPSSDGSGDANPDSQGSWTPASLPGLSLWLNDDVGLVQDSQKPGYIKHWLDQSGNANDANGGCNGTCPEPGYDQAAIHGHDAIICTGYM